MIHAVALWAYAVFLLAGAIVGDLGQASVQETIVVVGAFLLVGMGQLALLLSRLPERGRG